MKTNKHSRTKKKFVDYNDYKDRPFGLKWGTAFAIDELNKVIVDNKEKSLQTIVALPLMSREEIDEVLQIAFFKSKRVSIQLNEKDELGDYLENIEGVFQGEASESHILIGNEALEWENIRSIQIIE